MKRVFVLVVAPALALAACSPALDTTSDPTPATPSTTAGLAPADSSGSWELTEGTVDAEAIPLVDGFPITLLVTADGVGGRASCNSYFGSYDIDGSKIGFSELGQTEMACSPTETMDAERLYLGALTRAESFAIDGDTLRIEGQGVLLRYELLPPVPESELLGTVWMLDSLVSSDAVSSVSGEPATLELFTDGSMIGSTGCRSLTGSYVIAGAEVVMTEMSANGECPDDLAAQDNHVVSVLGDGFRVGIEGGTLTLHSMGEEGLIYKASS